MRSLTVGSDVIMHLEQDEAFLLHIGSGRYFGLNHSGVIVWNALVNGTDPVDQLGTRWPNRPAELLRSDANALIERLATAGLVKEVVDEPVR
ncbi:MAG TPA: PqqD family protein [Acidimicrobiales bacterium]|nr:PqqD family protein [Acidimicrobiales bacterium]